MVDITTAEELENLINRGNRIENVFQFKISRIKKFITGRITDFLIIVDIQVTEAVYKVNINSIFNELFKAALDAVAAGIGKNPVGS